MSRIYKALEKAQREREEKGAFLILDTEETDKAEKILLSLSSWKGRFPTTIGLLLPTGLSGLRAVSKTKDPLDQDENHQPPKNDHDHKRNQERRKDLFSRRILLPALPMDLHAQALLVDCDLRNPTIAKWFNLLNDKGLSDYLGDGQFPNSSLRRRSRN